MQVRNLVEVEVISDDLGVEILGQFEQLEIDLADVRVVIGHDLNSQQRIALHALEDIEAAAAALAAR